MEKRLCLGTFANTMEVHRDKENPWGGKKKVYEMLGRMCGLGEDFEVAQTDATLYSQQKKERDIYLDAINRLLREKQLNIEKENEKNGVSKFDKILIEQEARKKVIDEFSEIFSASNKNKEIIVTSKAKKIYETYIEEKKDYLEMCLADEEVALLTNYYSKEDLFDDTEKASTFLATVLFAVIKFIPNHLTTFKGKYTEYSSKKENNSEKKESQNQFMNDMRGEREPQAISKTGVAFLKKNKLLILSTTLILCIFLLILIILVNIKVQNNALADSITYVQKKYQENEKKQQELTKRSENRNILSASYSVGSAYFMLENKNALFYNGYLFTKEDKKESFSKFGFKQNLDYYQIFVHKNSSNENQVILLPNILQKDANGNILTPQQGYYYYVQKTEEKIYLTSYRSIYIFKQTVPEAFQTAYYTENNDIRFSGITYTKFDNSNKDNPFRFGNIDDYNVYIEKDSTYEKLWTSTSAIPVILTMKGDSSQGWRYSMTKNEKGIYVISDQSFFEKVVFKIAN